MRDWSKTLLGTVCFMLLFQPVRAQQAVSVPFQFEVAAGQKAIYGVSGVFDFGALAPGESGRALVAPTFTLEDTRISADGFHLTIQAGDFASGQGESFSAGALVATGPAVSVQAIDARGPMPLVLDFPDSTLEQPVRMLQADQALVVDQGKGIWRVDVVPDSFILQVPANTRPGRYTSTVTLTLNVGI